MLQFFLLQKTNEVQKSAQLRDAPYVTVRPSEYANNVRVLHSWLGFNT